MAKNEDEEIKILLVDDHDVVRRGLKNILEGFDAFVICDEAADGEEAIRSASRCHPDVIIMDITMPRMNGFEAARVIHESTPDVPILMLSMHVNEAAVKAAKETGAQGYVSKSQAGSTLINAVCAVLKHQQYFPKDLPVSE